MTKSKKKTETIQKVEQAAAQNSKKFISAKRLQLLQKQLNIPITFKDF